MEQLAPDVLDLIRRRVTALELQVTLLQRECERLERSNERTRALKEKYRDEAKKLRASRDRWEGKAKARRQEIWRLRWQLDPEHKKHPLKAAA